MKRIAAGMIMIFALGCGGLGDLGGLGGLGDILGSSTPQETSDVRGTVVGVDRTNQRIDLDVAYVNNLQNEQRGASIYYDRNTVVEYRNQTYSPENLERGDQIAVVGSNVNGRYVATRITVVSDATP